MVVSCACFCGGYGCVDSSLKRTYVTFRFLWLCEAAMLPAGCSQFNFLYYTLIYLIWRLFLFSEWWILFSWIFWPEMRFCVFTHLLRCPHTSPWACRYFNLFIARRTLILRGFLAPAALAAEQWSMVAVLNWVPEWYSIEYRPVLHKLVPPFEALGLCPLRRWRLKRFFS